MLKFLLGFATAGLVAAGMYIVKFGTIDEYGDGSEIMVRPAFKQYLQQTQQSGVKLPFKDVPAGYTNEVEKRVVKAVTTGQMQLVDNDNV